eukprot:3338335-Pleurochrysis_carterae.AAC.2
MIQLGCRIRGSSLQALNGAQRIPSSIARPYSSAASCVHAVFVHACWARKGRRGRSAPTSAASASLTESP